MFVCVSLDHAMCFWFLHHLLSYLVICWGSSYVNGDMLANIGPMSMDFFNNVKNMRIN